MEGGGEDPLLLGKQQRLEKLQKSIGMSGRPGALHDVSNQTFGLTTPVSELEALRGANQKGSWTIFATPRREKALDKSMGNVTKVFPGGTLMEGTKYLLIYIILTRLSQMYWPRLFSSLT
jgi:hypothetical protein